jgi:hypothetical protein
MAKATLILPMQVVEEGLGLHEIRRVETLSKSTKDGGEEISGLLPFALLGE